MGMTFVVCPACAVKDQAACRTCKGTGLVDASLVTFSQTPLKAMSAGVKPKRRLKAVK